MKSKIQRIKYRHIAPFVINAIKKIKGDRNPASNSSNFFFIMGSGRNGSTLLAAMLNKHFRIFIPPEQYVLPFFGMKWQINRYLNYDQFTKRLANEFSLSHRTVNWEINREEIIKATNGLVTKQVSYQEIMTSIFRRYAHKKGKNDVLIVGEKSPLNTHFIPTLYPEYEHSKYIFLVRDPRDVVASYAKVEGHPAQDPSYAMWKWKDSLRMMRYLRKRGANVLLLKYEDLVKHPTTQMNNVLEFLEVEPKSGLLDLNGEADNLGVSDLQHHQNLKNPINVNSIGKWKEVLDDSTVALIEKAAKNELSKLGYE